MIATAEVGVVSEVAGSVEVVLAAVAALTVAVVAESEWVMRAVVFQSTICRRCRRMKATHFQRSTAATRA